MLLVPLVLSTPSQHFFDLLSRLFADMDYRPSNPFLHENVQGDHLLEPSIRIVLQVLEHSGIGPVLDVCVRASGRGGVSLFILMPDGFHRFDKKSTRATDEEKTQCVLHRFL